MFGHKLPNKTKSATIAESKKISQLNRPQTLYFLSPLKIELYIFWGNGWEY
jgi:hypothetical protein